MELKKIKNIRAKFSKLPEKKIIKKICFETCAVKMATLISPALPAPGFPSPWM